MNEATGPPTNPVKRFKNTLMCESMAHVFSSRVIKPGSSIIVP
jgi:hypothetical protein